MRLLIAAVLVATLLVTPAAVRAADAGITIVWDQTTAPAGDRADLVLSVIGHASLDACLAVTAWVDQVMVTWPKEVVSRAVGFDRVELRGIPVSRLTPIRQSLDALPFSDDVSLVEQVRTAAVVPPRHGGSSPAADRAVSVQTLESAAGSGPVTVDVSLPTIPGLSDFQQAYFDMILVPQLMLDRSAFSRLTGELLALADDGDVVSPSPRSLAFVRDHLWRGVESALGYPRELFLAGTADAFWVIHIREAERRGDRLTLAIQLQLVRVASWVGSPVRVPEFPLPASS